MRIDHLALWVNDLEKMKTFYLTYFAYGAGEKYTNVNKSFTSYFISFEGSNTRLEIMNRPDIETEKTDRSSGLGLTHLAISVGEKDKVDALTERLRTDGYTIYGEPRTTGDGYYEAVILDPEGNLIEITT